jgi:tetratricopeptide (TPR) repeat protein
VIDGRTSAVADGDELLRMHALAADAFQVTGSVLLKLGDATLAALAAERSMQAAIRSADPVALAASARVVTHSLICGGHASRAKELAAQAAQQLAAQVRQPGAEALSVYGALMLRGAIAAADLNDRDAAAQMLDEAADAAQRLGRDDNAHWTAFGPTNVRQHRVHVAVLLGDAGNALHLARQIDARRIRIAERKATLFIDMAAALNQWGKHERAYQTLRVAEQAAPEEVRASRTVHQLVGDLSVRAPHNVRRRVHEFAETIGVER